MELISKLGIDWKLLIAQIVNFAILVFVLYKFVYHPVLGMLEKRSKMVAKGVEDAKKSEELLKHIEETRAVKLAETERRIGKMLTDAKTESDLLKAKILEEAQKQSEDLLKRAKIQLAEEKEKAIQEIKAESVRYVVALAGKILEKEFDEEHQKKLISSFRS